MLNHLKIDASPNSRILILKSRNNKAARRWPWDRHDVAMGRRALGQPRRTPHPIASCPLGAVGVAPLALLSISFASVENSARPLCASGRLWAHSLTAHPADTWHAVQLMTCRPGYGRCLVRMTARPGNKQTRQRVAAFSSKRPTPTASLTRPYCYTPARRLGGAALTGLAASVVKLVVGSGTDEAG